MIVVDENLHDKRILSAIAAWYPGQVVSITALRPRSVIKDDAIPALLCGVEQPTFITINVTDFWKRIAAHFDYCVVNVDVDRSRVPEVPALLQRLFRQPKFRTKAARMGKIIRATISRIEYYGPDWRVQTLAWRS